MRRRHRGRRRHGRARRPTGAAASSRAEPVDDGRELLGELEALSTAKCRRCPARRIISTQRVAPISASTARSIPMGLEHGCTYCFARPSYAFLGPSLGLDFETKLFAKTDAAQALEKELSSRRLSGRSIAMAPIPDPILADRATLPHHARHPRSLERRNHPVGIVTKSAHVRHRYSRARPSAGWSRWRYRLPRCGRSARAMEPRASTPDKRLETVQRRRSMPACRPRCGACLGLTDMEMERIWSAPGVRRRGPRATHIARPKIGDLFTEWLQANCPDRAKCVLSADAIDAGGKLYDANG